MTLDSIESASKGTTKAVLEVGGEIIHEWIEKFKNRELRFIGDPENIKLVKEQRASPELKLYSQYVKDKDLRTCIQMGLALRKLEKDALRLQKLRNVIFGRFQSHGLHVAQFVQIHILGKYIDHALQSAPTPEECGRRLENFLKEIDKFWLFVQDKHKFSIKQVSQTSITRIRAFSPPIFVLSSCGYGARGSAMKIQKNLEKALPEYSVEEYDDKNRKIVFFNRIDENNITGDET